MTPNSQPAHSERDCPDNGCMVCMPPLAIGVASAELDELRAWASVGRAGFCVHSFFAPARGQACAGCLVRESLRALGMLLDTLEHGAQDPMHGLVGIKNQDDAVRCARAIYDMVEEARRA